MLGKQAQELVFQDIAHDASAAAASAPAPGSISSTGAEAKVDVGGAKGAMPSKANCGNTLSTIPVGVRCTDGSMYEGIIIGADGAYSTIRLSLYRHLRERGEMLAADKDGQNGPMRAQFRVLVGMTRPLDADRFELLKKAHSDVRVLISRGEKPFVVSKQTSKKTSIGCCVTIVDVCRMDVHCERAFFIVCVQTCVRALFIPRDKY